MQSLKHSTPTQKVAISLVAPGFVPTPIMSDLPGQEDKSLDEVFALLHAAGLRSSRPETVASAIVYLADGGLAHNGTALSVNDDKVVNLEALLRDNRPEYVRNELGYLFSSSI
jgi:NAD(P)-dependent dehydrogenase (short-subunit alcohol dehydrogenase family)